MSTKEKVKKGEITAQEAVDLFKSKEATGSKTYAWLVKRVALEKAAAEKKAAKPEKTEAKAEAPKEEKTKTFKKSETKALRQKKKADSIRRAAKG